MKKKDKLKLINDNSIRDLCTNLWTLFFDTRKREK